MRNCLRLSVGLTPRKTLQYVMIFPTCVTYGGRIPAQQRPSRLKLSFRICPASEAEVVIKRRYLNHAITLLVLLD